MLDESFLTPGLSVEALWLKVSMFYTIIQMFGQLKGRDSLLILVTRIWLFDLYPKLQEKKLSKT